MAKLRAQLRPISPTMSWIRWSSRIGSIEDAARRKSIGYIGFPDKASADKFYNFVTKKRPDWKWKAYPEVPGENRDGEGITKPRKAERLTDYAYEVKWHRPNLDFMHGLIKWEHGDDIGGHELIEQAYRTVNV